MPGTYAQDALTPNLLTGATLNAAGTTNGTAVDNQWQDDVTFELKTATVTSTGNSATITVLIQASDDVTFAAGVVEIARLAGTGTDAAQSNLTLKARTKGHPGKRYIRARVIVAGTSPVYTGSVLKQRLSWDHWVESDTSAN